MGLFGSGVAVIAAQDGDETHSMTANAVTSLSLDPMLVLVCIARRAKMAGFLEKASGFSINILRDEQQALSSYFAGAWPEANPPPFRFVAWEGGPRLEGCLAAIGCEVHQSIEGGDHWIVVGRVRALHQGIEPRKPLLFYAGRYRHLDRVESEPAPDLGWVEAPTHVYYDPWQEA
jgi:flavin reductase (DIM6/NTAB) family NADH-FMN oxidoreductase RutF